MPRKKVEKEPESNPTKDLLVRVRKRAQLMMEADQTNRREAMQDMKFLHVPGEQWDEYTKKARGDDRPCYEFNKLRVTAKRVVNDMRANRPQGKVRAVEDGDKDTADVFEGLIRNIWNVSDGDTIIDYAAEYQVGAGMGAWRVNTRYSTDSAFDQDIVVEPIKNPFCLFSDPTAADPLKRDADDWLLTERISKSAFEARWPKAQRSDFDDIEFDDDNQWIEDETVRICEYWYKEPTTKVLCLLSDGKTIEKDGKTQIPPGVTVVRERTVKCHKIMMCIASGQAILEGPTEWAGAQFPFVQVYGEWMVIDGKPIWFGLTRHSKDAQRAYNISRTATMEKAATAPNAKFWATPKQAEGNLERWKEAHVKNFPFLLYNPDSAAAGPPTPMQPDIMPPALVQEAMMSSEDIKATSGIYDASLGAQSNETSGRAINARKQQGEIATFNYADNMGKGIRRTWEILVDIIPKIYDTARTVRILGVDGAEKYVKINGIEVDPATQQQKPLNDLSRGKYDVTITVGPSFSTQRQEAAELYTQLASTNPQLWGVAGDLMMKSMDLPYAEQIAERIKTLLPPPIQQMLSEGKPMPPEVQAVMNQAQMAMQQVQQQGMLVQQAAQEVEASKAEADKAKQEVQTLIANLKTEEARFEARIAKEVANLAQREAGIAVKDAQVQAKEGQQAVSEDRESLTGEAQQAIQTIQALAEQFAQLAAQVMQQIEQKALVQSSPKRKQIRAKRVNGELIAQIDELDDMGNLVSSRPAKVSRQNGELVGEA